MEVKGALKDAQLEHFTTAGRPAFGKFGRKIYDTDLNAELIDIGTAWKTVVEHFQDQFNPSTEGAFRSSMHAVGSVLTSFFTEAQFQAELDTKWCLCDGRSVVGSDYQTITASANIPDLRGVFIRGKNNGRSDGNEDESGDRVLGTFQNDSFQEHTHAIEVFHSGLDDGGAVSSNKSENGAIGPGTVNTDAQGTPGETKPKNIAVNYFIKINR